MKKCKCGRMIMEWMDSCAKCSIEEHRIESGKMSKEEYKND